MKRTQCSMLCLFLCAVFSVSFTATSAEDPLITEIQRTNADSTYRYIYYYNDNQEKTLETKYVLSNSTWARREQTEWMYNGGLLIEQIVRTWHNGEWQVAHVILFDYVNNQLDSKTHSQTELGAVVSQTKTTYQYTGEKLVDEKQYRWQNEMWVLSSEKEFSYNADSQSETIRFKNYADNAATEENSIEIAYNNVKQPETIRFLTKQDGTWLNTALTTYYYDPNTQLKSSEIGKLWNAELGKMENSQLIEYQYDASGRLVEENYQAWDISFWRNTLRYSYQYDASGLLTKTTTSLPIYNDYRPAWSIVYSDFMYSKASVIEAKNEFWGGETGAPVTTFIPYQFNNESVVEEGSRISISYIPVDETGIITLFNAKNKNQIRIYPNPSKAIFYFDSEQYAVSEWTVADVSGKIILTHKQNERSGVIDLGDYEAGIYLLQVVTPEGVKTQKLIRQ